MAAAFLDTFNKSNRTHCKRGLCRADMVFLLFPPLMVTLDRPLIIFVPPLPIVLMHSSWLLEHLVHLVLAAGNFTWLLITHKFQNNSTFRLRHDKYLSMQTLKKLQYPKTQIRKTSLKGFILYRVFVIIETSCENIFPFIDINAEILLFEFPLFEKIQY